MLKARLINSIAVMALLAAPALAQTAAPPAKPVTIPPYETPPEKIVQPPASAALSPDGLRAAWASNNNKSIVSATRATPSAEWSSPNRLLTTRGVVHQIVFSPDGKSIAYENQRTWTDNGKPDDTWQFICVYDIATRRISYVDPSFDIDSDPSWSGDDKQISFTRKVAGLPDKHLTKPVTRLRLGAWEPPPKRAGESFTMASVIAAPYIYPPAPSGDGTAIAYITREARDRNVYFLREGQPARLLVSYSGDDGIDMSEPPVVSKTGAAVAYARGGRLNKQGDIANPSAFPDMPQQQVWIIGSVGKDVPRLLGLGTNPIFTPDDRYVLWHSAGKLMGAALIFDHGRLLGVGAPEEFLSGQRQGMRFSPDGSKLASLRGDAVEVYDFATKTAVVIPHGQDIDQGPVWSPDGRHLAFRREPANAPEMTRNSCGGHSRYCGPSVEDQPWAIWTVDVADLQQPRKVWQGHTGVGSVFYAMDQNYSAGTHGDQMFWSADNHIVFSWEGDGWRHLYSVPSSGGQATLLTPGDGEVETSAMTMDRKSIVYATNIGDLGRRHISTVGVEGKAMSVTKGETDQWSPIPLAGGKLAYIDSSWAIPPVIVVRDSAGKTETAAFPKAPAGFPSNLLIKPQLVDFPASDGQTAYGQLFVPAHTNGCAIIFSHGGIRRQMLPGFHYMDAYTYLYEMNQYLAGRGCVVLSVEYRSSIMRGEAFRNAPGWGFAANSELLDFVGAAKYLMARKDVDAKRGVGIYGLSWGGYMTAELLAQHSDLFSVGFDMAGVHDADDPEEFKNSAIGHLDSWTSPVFLAQGDDDMNVNFNEGTALARVMQAKRPNVEFKQEVLPGQTHDLYLTYEQLVGIYTKGSDWLLSHLGVR